jgi:hypothetical protein
MPTPEVQLAEVAYLMDTDLTQTVECAEKNCSFTGTLISCVCYRIWRGDRWGYFAFCSHAHALTCLPATALGQA